MSDISLEMTVLCYEDAKKIYPDANDINTRAEFIHKKTGMNLGSAKAYIKAFFQMRKGEKLDWCLASPGIEYYFKRIYNDFGKDALGIAMETVKEYLKYDPQNHPGLEDLIKKFENM